MSQTTAENTGASVEQTETKAKAPAKKASGGLASLKLAQLQELASQLGITGARRLRKADLVAKIQDHQRGGAVADREAAKKKEEAQKAQKAEQEAKNETQKKDSKKDRAAKADASEGESTSAKKSGASAQDADSADESARSGRGRRRRSSAAPAGAPSKGEKQAGDDSSPRDGDKSRDEKNHSEKHQNENESGDDSSEDSNNEGGRNRCETRNQRNRRNRRGRDRDRDREHNDGQGDSSEESDDRGSRNQRNRRNRNRDNNNDDQRNNRRDRQRNNRRNRGRNQIEVEDTELTEDDVLAPVAGILDVLDNYAFIRTSGYLPGPNDVYVTMKQVRQYNLRKGDAVVGAIRAPRDDENNNEGNNGNNRRNRYTPLIKLATVNGVPADENKERVNFNKLVPLYPEERLRLESGAKSVGPRIIDLVAPIGKGQRGLIVSPPKAGKTMILQSIADSIKKNNPEVHLMMVLVDERPEEVTDMQRTVDGEVIASTFDRPAEDHTTVAELAIERAKRLVEQGRDVVVLLDSMTRLGRAYNQAAPASGRILSGGVDAAALYPPKRFFGAARNIENGGSLTILATALVETGSKMDEVIFEEFKGTGNMELRLSRSLAEKRIFPAVDVNASSTRREENLLSPEELKIMWRLRRVLSSLEPQQALELLTTKIKETASNAEFLMVVNRTTLDGK
ncbi:transcription termination factor Rho [Pseudoglutamicibacter cumminsii]|uniref:transcription termination factor Rho n=1 Tax=Pseudoglutamicibacter cumminsii TaxID=156979 RepID=UPI0021A3ED50|nr:transcription termination factor Rho [Pseudoglutamicibacter cumminsii]MCT1685462.1 transcription termination factor Rho [Pseudoglutamicibacter cumminsii]